MYGKRRAREAEVLPGAAQRGHVQSICEGIFDLSVEQAHQCPGRQIDASKSFAIDVWHDITFPACSSWLVLTRAAHGIDG